MEMLVKLATNDQMALNLYLKPIESIEVENLFSVIYDLAFLHSLA